MTLIALASLTGCMKIPPGAVGTPSELAGVWTDDGGAVFIIEQAGRSRAELVSVVDYDGEAFQVQRSGYEGAQWTLDYVVPSTQYQVHVKVLAVEDDELTTTWSNVAPDGSTNGGQEQMTRVD